MARPTKLTPLAIERFLQATQAGAYPEVAAVHAGFSAASWYRYKKGRTPEHQAFVEEVERANAALEIRLAGTIIQEALTEPRWALAYLERRWPERWRARPGSIATDDGPDDAPTPAEAVVVIDHRLIDELVPKLLAAGRAGSGDGEAEDLDGFERDLPSDRDGADE